MNQTERYQVVVNGILTITAKARANITKTITLTLVTSANLPSLLLVLLRPRKLSVLPPPMILPRPSVVPFCFITAKMSIPLSMMVIPARMIATICNGSITSTSQTKHCDFNIRIPLMQAFFCKPSKLRQRTCIPLTTLCLLLYNYNNIMTKQDYF